MEEQNLYRAPDANLFAEPAAGGVGQASPLMIEELNKTRPWVFFLAILGLVGTGLMVLVIAGVSIAMLFVDTPSNNDPPALLMLVAGLAGGAIYGLPSILLLRYGLALRRIKIDESLGNVELALARQRTFWRAMGILVLAVFVLYGVVFAFAMIAGIAGSLTG